MIRKCNPNARIMKNKDVADLLERMGTLLEIKGELIFKIRAYFKAAENISNLSEDIEVLKNENRLSEIPGIGAALRDKITEYLETGKLKAYEELTQEVPASLLEIIDVPSVGPKKAKLFFEKLKIENLAELREAAETGKLLGLPGMQEKTIQNILKGIRIVRQGQERMNLGKATSVAEEFASALEKIPEIRQMVAAGSLRRGCETVGDIDILVESAHPAKIMEAFVHLPMVKSINAHGESKSSVLTKDNVQVDLRIVDEKSFGAALLYFTGSKDFNVKLRQIAIKEKKKVNEYGIFSVQGETEKYLAGKTEKDCFRALGLPDIPPELREEIGEAKLFGGTKIPKLIELKDIRGDLHTHSTWSDGRHSIAQMAEAARTRGYEYLGISDHSPRLRVARGVSAADLKKKKKEIDQLNKKLKDFRVLFGTEVEIDTEGNLDYNKDVLSSFDIVIAAIHSGFEQSPRQLTQRLLKACQNKYVNVIAHPTGVHIGKRDPYDFDFKGICKAAVEHNVFLEINAFPIRLDLNSANVYFARSQGVNFCINTDAHSTEHLEYMKFGIAVARRGWLEKRQVLNTLPLGEMEKVLRK